MLEKTAASLEPCGFQRVVPGATQSLRSTRQLHNTFWQHGAAGLELTATWQALMHGTLDIPSSASNQTQSSTLNASTFLLDFLYPRGAIALGRRLTRTNLASSSCSNSLVHRQRFEKPSPCLYASSSSRRKKQADNKTTNVASGQKSHKHSSSNATGGSGATDLEDVDVKETDKISNTVREDPAKAVDTQIHEIPGGSNTTVNGSNHSTTDGHHSVTLKILLNSTSDDPEDVWYHYTELDESSQAVHIHQVLVYLAQSGRISDSWKISELFHKLPSSQWTNQVFVAGVTAEINLQNVERALEVFVKGLEYGYLDELFLVDALDLILASALRSSTPESLKRLWKHYPAMAARWDFAGITSQLKQVALVPGLATKALEFETRERVELEDPEGGELGREALDALQRILVRRALPSCADDLVIPLLDLTKDSYAFEEFLCGTTSRGKQNLAIEVYAAYRDLPGSRPSHDVLHEMFQAYKRLRAPMSLKYDGLQEVWNDWYNFHGIPPHKAFQKHLSFYAARGDVGRVYELWIGLMEQHRDNPYVSQFQADDIFAHLLQVHAVQGEFAEAQRIFDDIRWKFRIEPTTYCWNILLNAYVKAGDYEGAISVFEGIVAVGKSDAYSFGTMMQMAGDRGDLGLATDIYRQSRRNQIPASSAIFGSLIDAYCRNDHPKAAEDLCLNAVKKGIFETRIWNNLLSYHATRRDLGNINRILDVMAEKGVPYDSFTYLQLLRGLALCRQSSHALSLLAVALKDKVFEATAEHFHIVMSALLITGEPGPVRRLHKLMQDEGFPTSSHSLFRLTQALAQWKKFAPQLRSRATATEWVGKAFRSFTNIYGLEDRNVLKRLSPPLPRPSSAGELLGQGIEKYHFSTMVEMLTQLKDFFRARELADLYVYLFKGRQESDNVLPVRMLNSVMLANLYEKKYDEVSETWNVLFETAKKESKSADYTEGLPHTPKVSARYRYVLSDGLAVMQKMLLIKGDANGLISLVREIREAGFEIDSKNWNYYVQVLVKMKKFEESFRTCEKMLMPNWTGWYVARARETLQGNLSLDARRMGSTPRHLRPIATTLYHLARGYMELDRVSPFSADAAKQKGSIERHCVQVVRAIKSMSRVYSNLENQILGEEDFFKDAEADADEHDLDLAPNEKDSTLGI
ncbi:uncharacterized protein F4822DRAFT_422263 [Hypoxylon trugodes]|uniref:uncharacterized protein n=1 Tax=Hypoxylon trugodes TaxID=326681 RepID=UPI00219EBA17|nr:uncharacterized protein F4822DRAFT_422263 [Hypoxylon trugodes]KAI1383139.1 hypothetical protein F4822DRAFT_422263 [Hypoxylon trugodes]